MVEGEERPLHRLTRTEGGTETDGTPEMLGYIDVQFLDRTAAVPNRVAHADQIEVLRVHFSVILPHRNDKTGVKGAHRMMALPHTPVHE